MHRAIWQQQQRMPDVYAAHRYPPSSRGPTQTCSPLAVRRAHCPVPAALASPGQRACVAAPSETIGWDDLEAIRSVVEAQLCTTRSGGRRCPASPWRSKRAPGAAEPTIQSMKVS